jgi:hypothetical protein
LVPQAVVHGSELPREQKGGHHHMLGHRGRVTTGRIGNQNAGFCRRLDRNQIKPGAMPHGRVKARRYLEKPRGYRGRNNDNFGIRTLCQNRFRGWRRGDAKRSSRSQSRLDIRMHRMG